MRGSSVSYYPRHRATHTPPVSPSAGGLAALGRRRDIEWQRVGARPPLRALAREVHRDGELLSVEVAVAVDVGERPDLRGAQRVWWGPEICAGEEGGRGVRGGLEAGGTSACRSDATGSPDCSSTGRAAPPETSPLLGPSDEKTSL